jgi:hypothetical protein
MREGQSEQAMDRVGVPQGGSGHALGVTFLGRSAERDSEWRECSGAMDAERTCTGAREGTGMGFRPVASDSCMIGFVSGFQPES